MNIDSYYEYTSLLELPLLCPKPLEAVADPKIHFTRDANKIIIIIIIIKISVPENG
jgi:hypothetical protein